jgi:hypothetical protein
MIGGFSEVIFLVINASNHQIEFRQDQYVKIRTYATAAFMAMEFSSGVRDPSTSAAISTAEHPIRWRTRVFAPLFRYKDQVI